MASVHVGKEASMNLPAGVSSHTVQTKRLRMKYIES